MSELLDHRADLPLSGRQLDWLCRLRDTAAERFTAIGFPSKTDEDWKYTNVRPIARRQWVAATPTHNGVATADVAGLAIAALQPHRAVFVNGYFDPALSDLAELPDGVVVTGLARVLEHQPQHAAGVLGSVAPVAGHGFTALNTACLSDGAFVSIEPGVVVQRPIELLFVNTAGSELLAVQPRNLIRAGANSQATIIERFAAPHGGRYLSNAVTELIAEPGSKLEHYKLQLESEEAYHIGGLFARLERDARVDSHNIALGGAIARTDLEVCLVAEGAFCGMNGLYVGSGRQHLDNFTRIDHQSPRCGSDEYYKGVLDGRARAVFHGRIVVHPDAQHTDAQQQNRNLLLSADAEVDTKPQLEIYADDVKCSHGATVGQLQDDAVFYLRSRAIDETTARMLLTYAFANDLLQRLSLEPIRQQLEHQLTAKLFQAGAFAELM